MVITSPSGLNGSNSSNSSCCSNETTPSQSDDTIGASTSTTDSSTTDDNISGNNNSTIGYETHPDSNNSNNSRSVSPVIFGSFAIPLTVNNGSKETSNNRLSLELMQFGPKKISMAATTTTSTTTTTTNSTASTTTITTNTAAFTTTATSSDITATTTASSLSSSSSCSNDIGNITTATCDYDDNDNSGNDSVTIPTVDAGTMSPTTTADTLSSKTTTLTSPSSSSLSPLSSTSTASKPKTQQRHTITPTEVRTKSNGQLNAPTLTIRKSYVDTVTLPHLIYYLTISFLI